MSSPTKLNTGNPASRPVSSNLVLNAENRDVEREQLNRILNNLVKQINASSSSNSGGSITFAISNNDGTISVVSNGNTFIIGIADGGVSTSQLANNGVTTSKIATVNSNVGTFGSATQTSTFTVNAQGQVTGASNTSIAIPSTQVTDFTEAAQDAVGGMVNATLTYNDGGPSLGINLSNANSWVGAQTFTSVDINGSAAVNGGNLTVFKGSGDNQRVVISVPGTDVEYNATRAAGTVPRHVFKVDATTYATLSSSSFDVTGALSATSTATTTAILRRSGAGDIISWGVTGGQIAYSYADSIDVGVIDISNGGGAFNGYLIRPGSNQFNIYTSAAVRGSFSNTGLSVTGTLSCTGNATLGDAATDAHTANGSLTVTTTSEAGTSFLVQNVHALAIVNSAGQTRTLDLTNGSVQTIEANQGFTLNFAGPAGKAGRVDLFVYWNTIAGPTITSGTGAFQAGNFTKGSAGTASTVVYRFYWTGFYMVFEGQTDSIGVLTDGRPT